MPKQNEISAEDQAKAEVPSNTPSSQALDTSEAAADRVNLGEAVVPVVPKPRRADDRVPVGVVPGARESRGAEGRQVCRSPFADNYDAGSEATILNELEDGLITIDEAEQRASQNGNQLIHEPEREFEDPSEHPDRRVYWTLPMTLAWLTWRTMDKVIEQTDEWRAQAKRYVDLHIGHPLNSHRLRRIRSQRGHRIGVDYYGPATVGDVFAEERDRVERAWDELKKKLENGDLPSTAIDKGRGMRAKIPPFQWHDLFHYAPGSEPEVFTTNAQNGPQYLGVIVRRDRVLDLWRDEKGKSNSHVTAPDGEIPAAGAKGSPRRSTETTDTSTSNAHAKPKRSEKRGPKPSHPWPEIEAYMAAQIRCRGGVSAERRTRGWRRAEIVATTLAWCSSTNDIAEPVLSEMYEHLRQVIAQMKTDSANSAN